MEKIYLSKFISFVSLSCLLCKGFFCLPSVYLEVYVCMHRTKLVERVNFENLPLERKFKTNYIMISHK
jgi:hypothetical protein